MCAMRKLRVVACVPSSGAGSCRCLLRYRLLALLAGPLAAQVVAEPQAGRDLQVAVERRAHGQEVRVSATSWTRSTCAPRATPCADRGERAGQPLARRAPEQRADEVLARDREQDRPAQLVQLVEAAQQLDRLRGLLAEVRARADQQPALLDAERARLLQPAVRKRLTSSTTSS